MGDEAIKVALTENHIKFEGPKLCLSILFTFLKENFSHVVFLYPDNRIFPYSIIKNYQKTMQQNVVFKCVNCLDHVFSYLSNSIYKLKGLKIALCLPYNPEIICSNESNRNSTIYSLRKLNNNSNDKLSVLYYLDSINKFDDSNDKEEFTSLASTNLNNVFGEMLPNPKGLSYKLVTDYLISACDCVFYLYEKHNESGIDIKKPDKLHCISIHKRKRSGILQSNKFNFTVDRLSGYMKLLSLEKYLESDTNEAMLKKNNEKKIFDQKASKKDNEYLPYLYNEDEKLDAIRNPMKTERGLIYYVADREDDFDEEDPDNDLNL